LGIVWQFSHEDRNLLFDEGTRYCCQDGMPDRQCLSNGAPLEWFHYVSMILCIIYTLGIPYFVYRLIARGTFEIDRNYNIPKKLQETKEREAKLRTQLEAAPTKKEKKASHTNFLLFFLRQPHSHACFGMNKSHRLKCAFRVLICGTDFCLLLLLFLSLLQRLKKEITDNRKQFRAAWADYCKEYKNAQNYLYFSYVREKRYAKCAIMSEKLVLLVIILYFEASNVQEFRTVAGMAVVGLSFLIGVISRPFSDYFEDIMDSCCRLTNTVNGFVGVIGDKFGLDPPVCARTVLCTFEQKFHM
jgi:hypothetical protein